MADGQIVRFKIGEAFPADERLARWVTVCAMALNDLLLVNRWLWPRLKEEVALGVVRKLLPGAGGRCASVRGGDVSA